MPPPKSFIIHELILVEWERLWRDQNEKFIHHLNQSFSTHSFKETDYLPPLHCSHLCQARVWGEGFGRQCCHKPKYGDYCYHHRHKLPAGRIDEKCPYPLPRQNSHHHPNVFPKWSRFISHYAPKKNN